MSIIRGAGGEFQGQGLKPGAEQLLGLKRYEQGERREGEVSSFWRFRPIAGSLHSDASSAEMRSRWQTHISSGSADLKPLRDELKSQGYVVSPPLNGFSGLGHQERDIQLIELKSFLDNDVLPVINSNGFGKAKRFKPLDDYDIRDPYTIADEMGNNILLHARSGLLTARKLEKSGFVGVEFCELDTGPGITDFNLVFKRGATSKPSTDGPKGGVGGSNIWLNSDELSITSIEGRGTLWRAIKWRRS